MTTIHATTPCAHENCGREYERHIRVGDQLYCAPHVPEGLPSGERVRLANQTFKKPIPKPSTSSTILTDPAHLRTEKARAIHAAWCDRVRAEQLFAQRMYQLGETDLSAAVSNAIRSQVETAQLHVESVAMRKQDALTVYTPDGPRELVACKTDHCQLCAKDIAHAHNGNPDPFMPRTVFGKDSAEKPGIHLSFSAPPQDQNVFRANAEGPAANGSCAGSSLAVGSPARPPAPELTAAPGGGDAVDAAAPCPVTAPEAPLHEQISDLLTQVDGYAPRGTQENEDGRKFLYDARRLARDNSTPWASKHARQKMDAGMRILRSYHERMTR